MERGGRSYGTRLLLAGLVLALLGLNAVAVRARLERAPTFDEAEYLHATWLMSRGKRLYRDFNEDHAPFLPLLLQAVQPAATTTDYPTLDVPRFVARARVLMAVLGSLAALAAALFAGRVTGSRVAPLVVLASLLGSEATFIHGVVEVRNDPPTLLLFWVGALLMASRAATRAGAIRVGLGLGLIGVAMLWNPKWPLEALAVAGLAALWLLRGKRVRLAAWTLGSAAFVAALPLVVVLKCASAGDFVFFTYRYNLAFIAWFGRSPAVSSWFEGKAPFHFCALPFHGYAAASAWLVVAVALAVPRVRARLADLPGWSLVLALVLAAFAELRFFYPWPRLWPQYYLMWSFVVAIAYGAVAAVIAAFVRAYAPERAQRLAIACASGGVVAIATGAYFAAWRELRRDPERSSYFRDVSWVQRHLREGDTVWLGPGDAHPIGAEDASYYWFSFIDLVPFSVEFATTDPARGRLPSVRATDWPPCRAADRIDDSVRFVSVEAGALAEPCMARLSAASRLRETPVPGVWQIDH